MLIAFDGTWNSDRPGTEQDTNVCWFARAYTDTNKRYLPGVGTRFGFLGRAIGGMTGAGGRTRISEALEFVHMNRRQQEPVDVVGFSRGAALALHFCNQLAKLPQPIPVRFLGLWDCVPSFGAASIDANIGWDLELPDNVVTCYHALALDERRHTFDLHRLTAKPGRLTELWFRGVHSDVGGGNANPALSSISLNWMLRQAQKDGLPIDPAVVAANQARQKMGLGISDRPWYDFILNRARVVPATDRIHASVTYVARCVNPPAGCLRIDNDGLNVGAFEHA